MLRNCLSWPQSRRFRSGLAAAPRVFFGAALKNATTFDLMLGFFSSSAINALADGFATFLANGGRMRLIINDVLSPDDKEAILRGAATQVLPFDLSDLPALKATLSRRDRLFFDCLAWLVNAMRIDIRAVRPAEGRGIAHTKCGLFDDGRDRVAFDGSCNFSWTALMHNIESVSVSCSWDGAVDAGRVASVADDFERTFAGRDESVCLVPTLDIATELNNIFGGRELQELLDEEDELRKQTDTNDALRAAGHNIAGDDEAPQFPFPGGPREYQVEALRRWKDNGQKGLFAMATGTGKTVTALNCLLAIYHSKGYYKAIILVPTRNLVTQWLRECHRFGFCSLVEVSAANTNSTRQLEQLYEEERTLGHMCSYIVVSTYQSFVRETTFALLTRFSRRELLFIADEAHNLGAGGALKRLHVIPYQRRLGLSATPHRQFDDEGNNALNEFFNLHGHYTFNFSMKQAIDCGALCRYYYYPHLVELNPTEMEQYQALSAQIAKHLSHNALADGCGDGYTLLMALLLKRKRLIHRAQNKLPMFREIVRELAASERGLGYTLVYVPEATRPDYYEVTSQGAEREEEAATEEADVRLIDDYTRAVAECNERITVRQLTAGSREAEAWVKDFASGRLDVLTSMKCLDEGVDVPRAQTAIFCASTGNPRQFVQRRGRILRTHPDKPFAVIHDLVVAPRVAKDGDSWTAERRLLANELRRVSDFALLSNNPTEAESALWDVLQYYMLNIYNND